MSHFNEYFASKLFAAGFGTLFLVLGILRIKKVLWLLFTQQHDIDLYETSEIYVDFGATGYCGFNGVVALFFISLGIAFLYLGLFKKYDKGDYFKDQTLHKERLWH